MFYASWWHAYLNSLETVERESDVIFRCRFVTHFNMVKCTEQRSTLSSSAESGIWSCHHEEVHLGREDMNTAVLKSLSSCQWIEPCLSYSVYLDIHYKWKRVWVLIWILISPIWKKSFLMRHSFSQFLLYFVTFHLNTLSCIWLCC